MFPFPRTETGFTPWKEAVARRDLSASKNESRNKGWGRVEGRMGHELLAVEPG